MSAIGGEGRYDKNMVDSIKGAVATQANRAASPADTEAADRALVAGITQHGPANGDAYWLLQKLPEPARQFFVSHWASESRVLAGQSGNANYVLKPPARDGSVTGVVFVGDRVVPVTGRLTRELKNAFSNQPAQLSLQAAGPGIPLSRAGGLEVVLRNAENAARAPAEQPAKGGWVR